MTGCSSFSTLGGDCPASTSFTSRMLKTSTEWWATSARPDSLTMSGCSMPATSQASWTAATTSLAYSCIV